VYPAFKGRRFKPTLKKTGKFWVVPILRLQDFQGFLSASIFLRLETQLERFVKHVVFVCSGLLHSVSPV
jgi:hypothetical protein